MIDPSEFAKCFCAWLEAVCGKKDGEVVSIDGKPLRRSGGQKEITKKIIDMLPVSGRSGCRHVAGYDVLKTGTNSGRKLILFFD